LSYRVGTSYLKGWEIRCFNAIAWGDGPWSVPDLPIGSIGWSLGPHNLGGLRPWCIIFLTLLLDFHTYAVLSKQPFSNFPYTVALHFGISEYFRILSTPHHPCLYWNLLRTLPTSFSRVGGELGGGLTSGIA
jgi:hypothetical protein